MEISVLKNRIDVDLVYQYLTNSYWAKGRSREAVQKSIEHSLCYGLYKNGRQIGFARVLSDRTVFAYIMDVFIVPEERSKGHATLLMEYILSDRRLSQVDQWYLKTKDAQSFYGRFGFSYLVDQGMFMERTVK